jgi:glycosyltransferase involved in cell wall biosynthesis
MNIWCISKYASIPKYGAAARLFYLAKEFAKTNKVLLLTSDSNHLCDFPDTKKRFNFDKQDEVNICWVKTKKYTKTASIARILSWFDFEMGLFSLNRKNLSKPDVVLVSSLSLLSIVYGYYLKKRYNAYLVFEIRDIWPLTLVTEGGFSRWHPLSLFLGIIERFGYKKADLIAGTMPRLDLHVENILGQPKDVFCSPLGLDCSQVSTLELAPELDQYFPENKAIVGYAGSMGTSNALEPFISCIEQLSENTQVHFVLVGDGDMRNSYINRLKSKDNVTFISKIRQEKVQYFLSKCDVLYLSTHDSEIWQYGQSMNKVVQYMLSGKPVVASYSGYESMLNEAKSGVFIPSNNTDLLKEALLKYLTMAQEERKEFGTRGTNWIIENRMYSKLAQQYIDKIQDNLSVDR